MSARPGSRATGSAATGSAGSSPAAARSDAPAQDDWSDLLALRAEFPILQRTTYLISHSLGAMPRGVRDRLAEFAEVWATRGIRAWAEGWWASPVETTRASLAPRLVESCRAFV